MKRRLRFCSNYRKCKVQMRQVAGEGDFPQCEGVSAAFMHRNEAGRAGEHRRTWRAFGFRRQIQNTQKEKNKMFVFVSYQSNVPSSCLKKVFFLTANASNSHALILYSGRPTPRRPLALSEPVVSSAAGQDGRHSWHLFAPTF